MWTWNSDPFGTDAANPNPSGAGTFGYNLRFPGRIFDGQAGLHQNYFRDLDPAMGRYVEPDPIGLAAGSLSPFAYVRNHPIQLLDPSGLADINLFDPNPRGTTRAAHMREETPGTFLASTPSRAMETQATWKTTEMALGLGDPYLQKTSQNS